MNLGIKPLPIVKISPKLSDKLSLQRVHLIPPTTYLFKVMDGAMWSALDGGLICQIKDTLFPREKFFEGWVFKSTKKQTVVITPVANDKGFFNEADNNPIGKNWYMLSKNSVLKYPAYEDSNLVGLEEAVHSGSPFLTFLNDQLTYCTGANNE